MSLWTHKYTKEQISKLITLHRLKADFRNSEYTKRRQALGKRGKALSGGSGHKIT